MNKKMLVIMVAFFMAACSTINESTSYNYKNLSINVVTDSVTDPEFMKILEPYKNEIQSKLTEVISYSETGLMSYRPESPLSNFLSDLILDFAISYSRDNDLDIIPSISLFNHGGIRTSIPKGDITVGNIFELMPFENELVLLLLSGEQVIELCHYLTTRGGEGIAGISFGMNKDKAENIKIQGVKVDPSQKYWLITSDYIANGGDGMKVLTWAEKRINTNKKMRDIIIDHLKKMKQENKIVEGKADRRIYNVE